MVLIHYSPGLFLQRKEKSFWWTHSLCCLSPVNYFSLSWCLWTSGAWSLSVDGDWAPHSQIWESLTELPRCGCWKTITMTPSLLLVPMNRNSKKTERCFIFRLELRQISSKSRLKRRPRSWDFKDLRTAFFPQHKCLYGSWYVPC